MLVLTGDVVTAQTARMKNMTYLDWHLLKTWVLKKNLVRIAKMWKRSGKGKQETDGRMGAPVNVEEAVPLQYGYPNRIQVVEEFLMGMDYPGHLLCRINCVVWNVWGVLIADQLGLFDENKCRLLPVMHQTSVISLWATAARISGLHDGF